MMFHSNLALFEQRDEAVRMMMFVCRPMSSMYDRDEHLQMHHVKR